jgi:lipoate-protein ligase A
VAEPLITFDFTPESPEQALAFEEALLEWAEENPGQSGFLFFWEARTHFVVLGYGNRVDAEVNRENCARLKVPILRRCSGGGTVLQGPGCLNYSLILPIEDRSEIATITSTNRFVMERNRKAIEQAIQKAVFVRGCTDLALGSVKFSGNAQRRRRNALLFHGSFLLRFDLPLIERVLRMPTHQPDYRTGRSHSNFLMNLGISSDDLKLALRQAWGTKPGRAPELGEAISKLIEQKYGNSEWILKF